jgi:D-alanyl-D-alanine carboxypeptidase
MTRFANPPQAGHPQCEHDGVDAVLARLGISQTLLASRGLCRHAEAGDLELVQVDADGREHFLIPQAAAAWHEMKAAASSEGIELVVISAFRSVARQTAIIQRKLDAGIGIAEILEASAPPGYSEHHTGRAVDIATPGGPVLETAFETSVAFAWLRENANGFGFYLSYPENNRCGYQYEPWHWCFRLDGDVFSTGDGSSRTI